ncbi:MAG: hypothetical protein Q4P78_07740 [Rothia sp. (in: high G+C Gram-positive bacteria)]|uniref:hypothetical protein n=1 Tax=Rothia sp. (in: high G+C Gram-positive bacteria) TaxID=1885016 RepID=UPI0026E0031B|nr:hypothetical protein [Rothia sp. (in: high G+C Gram-positive bacteria)]MDO5751069.1 hypothetical protein [Rothia sp. (in: high G+C Gram-positive bacteria)]
MRTLLETIARGETIAALYQYSAAINFLYFAWLIIRHVIESRLHPYRNRFGVRGRVIASLVMTLAMGGMSAFIRHSVNDFEGATYWVVLILIEGVFLQIVLGERMHYIDAHPDRVVYRPKLWRGYTAYYADVHAYSYSKQIDREHNYSNYHLRFYDRDAQLLLDYSPRLIRDRTVTGNVVFRLLMGRWADPDNVQDQRALASLSEEEIYDYLRDFRSDEPRGFPQQPAEAALRQRLERAGHTA